MQMDKWLLISLAILLLLALPVALYPLRASKKSLFIIIPLMVCSLTLAYWQWGALPQWSEYQQQQEKQKKIVALMQTIKGPEQLIAKLKASLRANPNSAKGWYLLGRIYASQGEWLDAKAAFEKAYQLNPADETIVVNYGQSLWQLNQQQFNDTIRTIFNGLLQKNPQQPDALAMLAMDAFGSKNYQSAIDYWQKLLKLAPEHSEEAQMILKAIAKAQGEMQSNH